MRSGRFVLLIIVLLLCPGSRARAQDPAVRQLMGAAWSQGADAALRAYDALPPADRSPGLLVSVADQLLWTGKHREASALLARAETEAPLLTEVRFQQGRAALQRAERAAALSATGDYTISVLPGADHQMTRGNGYHPLYLARMVQWVASRFAEAERDPAR